MWLWVLEFLQVIFTFGDCSIFSSLISQVFIINNKLIKNHYRIIFLNEGKNRKLKIEVPTNVDELFATWGYMTIRKFPITTINYQNFIKSCVVILSQDYIYKNS